MKKTLFVISNFLIALGTNAGHQYYDLQIKEISNGWAGEGVYVTVQGTIEVKESCSSQKFHMSADTPMFDQNYSMLLASYVSGKKVGLYVSGCSGNNMSLRAVRLRE